VSHIEWYTTGGFCIQWWNEDWTHGEYIGVYNLNMSAWDTYFVLSKANMKEFTKKENGSWGSWRTLTRVATMKDVEDPRKAC